MTPEQIIEMEVTTMSRSITAYELHSAVRLIKGFRRCLSDAGVNLRWVADDIVPFMSVLHLICKNWGSSYIEDWTTKECFSSLAAVFVKTEFDVMRLVCEIIADEPGILLFRQHCIAFMMRFVYKCTVSSDDEAMCLLCDLIKCAPVCEEINIRNGMD